MSKFHINKHGVPAPCRATKGNCPLGGDGEHFKTEKEAQAYADKVNLDEYGALANTAPAKFGSIISEEAFQDSFGDGGWHVEDGMTTGVYSPYFTDPDATDGAKEAFKALPEEVQEIARADEDGFIAVSENNLQHYMVANVLSNNNIHGNKESNEYFNNELLPSLQKNFPKDIEVNKYGEAEISNELLGKITDFASEKLKEENALEINNNKIYLDGKDPALSTYSGRIHDRNWVDEYKAHQDKFFN